MARPLRKQEKIPVVVVPIDKRGQVAFETSILERPPPEIRDVPSLTRGQAVLVTVTIPQRGDPDPNEEK